MGRCHAGDNGLTNLDFVVMNPPFHEGGIENQALGQGFIKRAAQVLRTGGWCWLTANRHLPYEAILKPLFRDVTIVAEEGRLQDLPGAEMKAPASMRLDRLLANLGYGSRREVGHLARVGRIKIDGEPIVREIEERVPLTAEFAARVTINGEPLDPLPGLVILLNKPVGVTCSHKEAGPLVFSLLPDRWRLRDPAISAVGRLDKDTSGLLLLTDDGDILHKIISPKRHIPKRYIATLDRPLKGDEAAIFASGTLMLNGEDKPLLPADLEVLGEKQAALTIYEGRYHQVRRMFAATGNHVTALHRASIGSLTLPDELAEGEFRILDEAVIAELLASGKPSP